MENKDLPIFHKTADDLVTLGARVSTTLVHGIDLVIPDCSGLSSKRVNILFIFPTSEFTIIAIDILFCNW